MKIALKYEIYTRDLLNHINNDCNMDKKSHITMGNSRHASAQRLMRETCRTQEQFGAIHLKLQTSGQGWSRTFVFYFNCDKNFRVGHKYGDRVGKPETHIYFCLALAPISQSLMAMNLKCHCIHIYYTPRI